MDGSSIPNSPYEAMNHSWLVILNCLILGCSPKFWCFSLDFCWWNGRKTYKVEAGRYISWFWCTHLQGGASYKWLKSSHDSTTSIYKNHSEIGNLMKTTWIYITNLKTMKTIDISWYINKHFHKLIVIPVINHSQWEFQDPKMEVRYHIRPYFVGMFTYIGLKSRPYKVGTSILGSWRSPIDIVSYWRKI